MGKPPETTASTLPVRCAIQGANTPVRGVAQYEKPIEPDRLDDGDQIVGQVADPNHHAPRSAVPGRRGLAWSPGRKSRTSCRPRPPRVIRNTGPAESAGARRRVTRRSDSVDSRRVRRADRLDHRRSLVSVACALQRMGTPAPLMHPRAERPQGKELPTPRPRQACRSLQLLCRTSSGASDRSRASTRG
jgi:hypothetical protein